MVTVSVPGKIHLMGEHAVVYGKPALLAAINRRMSVTAAKGTRGIEIISDEPDTYVRHIVHLVLAQYKVNEEPDVVISISSEIPAGYHLGSSAAVAVATIGALSYFLKKIWNPIAINKLAFEAEKRQHGNPSGGDNTIVTFGGILWYRRELDFLKSIWQLPFRPHARLNHFFLINTGRPKETTGDMVNFIRSQYESHPDDINGLLDKNETQTRKITVALKEGNERELIEALKSGEQTLEGFGVVSKKVQPLIREIEKAGGAAKILGGGGKSQGVGFLLCYHTDKKRIESLCKKYHWDTLDIQLGEEGVRLDEK